MTWESDFRNAEALNRDLANENTRLRAEVEALRAMRSPGNAATWADEYNDMRDALAAAQKRIEGLEAALREYGQCLMTCRQNQGPWLHSETCTCGYADALRSAPPGAP